MRSLSFTALLCLIALVSVGLTIVRVSEGSLSRVFGAPPTGIGEALYAFDPAEIHSIELSGNGISARCVLTPEGWRVTRPWKDRMDPRVAQKIVEFALNARVESAIPEDKVESSSLGFEDGRIAIRMADSNREELARFVVGQRTAWVGTDPETGESFPTVFVEPFDGSRNDFIYAVVDSQNLHDALGEGFAKLRDHHPFLFHPNMVEGVRIKNRHGEMQLARSSPSELWRIVKPLELKGDRESLIRLLQGLFDLKATRVLNRSELTLPAERPADGEQIALRFFGAEDEVVLDLYPPEDPDSPVRLGVVDTRPDTVFELPQTTVPSEAEGESLVGLADLPLSVNDLRDPTLTAIDVRQLRAIRISPASHDDIVLTRNEPGDRFEVILDGKPSPPNETALFSLLKSVTETKVEEFVSDTATDLSPYGLDQPFLTLRFISFEGEPLQIDFGQSEDGKLHAIRNGSTSVVGVAPEFVNLIPVRIWEWRSDVVWNISAVNITRIERVLRGEEPLELDYNFHAETWKAKVGGQDRSAELAIDRANRFLTQSLELKASHWLRPGHPAAMAALDQPTMVLTIDSENYDDQGELAGIIRQRLLVATVSNGRIRTHYGRLENDAQPFLLDEKTVEGLALDLFDLD